MTRRHQLRMMKGSILVAEAEENQKIWVLIPGSSDLCMTNHLLAVPYLISLSNDLS